VEVQDVKVLGIVEIPGPDSGSRSYPSSPTSVSSFSANSPVLPTPHDFDNRAAGAANWEPSWLHDQTEQHSTATMSMGIASIPVLDQGCAVRNWRRISAHNL